MPNYQQIGDILGGMAAGLSGDSAGWQRNMMAREEMANQRAEREQEKAYVMQQRQQQAQQQEQERAIARMKTMFTDGAAAYKMAYANDWNGVVKLVQHRLEMSKHFPGVDFSDTARIGDLAARAAQGDQEAARSAFGELQQLVDVGRANGLIAPPEEKIIDGRRVISDPLTGKIQAAAIEGMSQSPKGQFVDGQWVTFDDQGNPVRKAIAGMPENSGAAQDRKLRERSIALAEQAEKRQSEQMTAGAQKVMFEAEDRAESSRRQASSMLTLADDVERAAMGGGYKAGFTEFMKAALGTQDDVTEFRRRFNAIRMGEALKNLPPGPATDRDVQLAMKGVPREDAPADQIASFLRGAAKVAEIDAEYNRFKAEYMGQTKTGIGFNQAWEKHRKDAFKPKAAGSDDDALINKYLD